MQDGSSSPIKNTEEQSKRARDRWRRALNKIQTATKHSNHRRIDTVIVDLRYYLTDFLKGEMKMYDDIDSGITVKVLKMTDSQREAHRLVYDNAEGVLKLNGEKADTHINGRSAKYFVNSQIFVMSKDAEIYLGIHYMDTTRDERIANAERGHLFHGSFLKDRPAEMAGTMSLKDGKIIHISSDSGHYKPDILDMYRGIAQIQKIMPNAIDEACKISFQDRRGDIPLKEFMKDMRGRDDNGIFRYRNLIYQRMHDRFKERNKLKAMHYERINNTIDDAIKSKANTLLNHISNKAVQEANDYLSIIDEESGKYALLDSANALNRARNITYNTSIKVDGEYLNASQLACRNKNDLILKILINQNPNYKQSVNNEFIKACTFGDLEMSSWLLDQGAEINSVNINGKSVLCLAFESNNKDMVDHLLSRAGDILTKESIKELVNSNNEGGYSILHWACENGHKDISEFLLQQGAEIHSTDQYSENSLHKACKNGHKDIAKLLLDKMASEDKKELLHNTNSLGYTLLYLACAHGHKEIAELLLEHGYDFKEKDANYMIRNQHEGYLYEFFKIFAKSGDIQKAKNIIDGVLSDPTRLNLAQSLTDALQDTNNKTELSDYIIRKAEDIKAKSNKSKRMQSFKLIPPPPPSFIKQTGSFQISSDPFADISSEAVKSSSTDPFAPLPPIPPVIKIAAAPFRGDQFAYDPFADLEKNSSKISSEDKLPTVTVNNRPKNKDIQSHKHPKERTSVIGAVLKAGRRSSLNLKSKPVDDGKGI
jgi:ankyrin repeat protein